MMVEQKFGPIHKTPSMLAVEAAHGGQDVRQVLMALYNQLGSQLAVARALGVAQGTVSHWLRLLDIETATWPEAWIGSAPPPLPERKP
jgi:hypothetical protein